MKLFRPSIVRQAAQAAIKELDLLTIDLEAAKKFLLNGHHDIQIVSDIKPKERKPNGTAGTDH